MTNREAIYWLNKNRPCISMTCNKENADNINNAIDIAINAIEENDELNNQIADLCKNLAVIADMGEEVLNND